MRIAILANCQGDSVAKCANAMNPWVKAEFISAVDLSFDAESFATLASGYDVLFLQNSLRPHVPAELQSKTLFFPTIVFPAFQPDMTYVRARRPGAAAAETVTNSMVMYHSKIALAGYVEGLSIDEVVHLFRPEVFAKVGYFDFWDTARDDLLAEGIASDMPLGAMFERWRRGGCFMYSFNHPDIRVMEDITRSLLKRTGIEIFSQNPSQYLDDLLKKMSIWPVYPAIAERLGLQGDFTFMKGMLQGTMSLREFVEESFGLYGQFDKSSLEPIGISLSDLRAQLGFGPKPELAAPLETPRNPYSTVGREQFWKHSVAGVAPAHLDPVIKGRFQVLPTDRIATAGSCFAQHIARTLSKSGFNYFVPETAPAGMELMEAKSRNYGVYSARFGNIYTARQLLQLIQRVEGSFMPEDDAWVGRDGGLVDPFRPQIEPGGFVDRAALLASREEHFEAVRRMLREMDVFVFTLGLTEGWRSRHDGAVFPLAPGVAGGVMDFDRYEFINFTAEEITADLHATVDQLKRLNPRCRIVLTVSPVPLIATYERQHALVATTYSKAALRTAADSLRRAYDHVEYFPSYEIITGAYNRGAYFEDDLREIKPEGVAHVMGVFMTHYTGQEREAGPAAAAMGAPQRPRSKLFDIVCDEEAIANF